jgi:AcrR family transcriptional regulator
MNIKNTSSQHATAAPVEPIPRGEPRKKVASAVAKTPNANKSAGRSPSTEKSPLTGTIGLGGVKRVRSNRRSELTIANILAATENIVLESGAERISILDVCQAADVSRGTFYRYFASQDELLDAFSRHKRDRFHVAMVQAVESHQDPDERFAALIRYLDNYLEHGKARRLLVVAPEYALGFFRRIFHDSVVRFQDVLGVVFDAWEVRYGVKLDRELVCELMIRYVLSEQLVPGDKDRRTLPRRIGRMLESLILGTSSRARR